MEKQTAAETWDGERFLSASLETMMAVRSQRVYDLHLFHSDGLACQRRSYQTSKLLDGYVYKATIMLFTSQFNTTGMSSEGPLADLTVIELAYYRAGPFCGTLLADMGADVIKIEPPSTGDPNRTLGPGPETRSGTFMALNRNKRSVTLDLKSDAGQEAALELIEDTDVVIENYALGVVDRLGLDYESLREVNDEIVFASIKGYGETGPYKDKKGVDLILQAEGGIMSITGPEDGEPVKVGQAIADLNTGMFATTGIMTRLHELERHREQDRIDEFNGKFDVSLFDTVVTLMNEYITLYAMTGDVPGPQGSSHQTVVPYQMFETTDGHIVTGAVNDKMFQEFAEVIGREDLQRYETAQDRWDNKDELIEEIQGELEKETTDHWIDLLTEHGFPNGPLNDISEVVEHEQALARGVVQEFDDPEWGPCLLPGFPIHFPNHDTTIRRSAPGHGEHNEEVFSEVAGDQTKLSEWEENGAFGD